MKKVLIPIIISVISIIFCTVYYGFIIYLVYSKWGYLLGIIPILFTVVMIKVCIERVLEIQKGEDNDISKY